MFRPYGDGDYQPIAPATQCFDEARVLGRVAECVSYLPNRAVYRVVEIDERIVGPEALLNLLPGENLSGVLEVAAKGSAAAGLEA